MRQKGGNASTNIQAGGNVTVGITYAEARQIALDLFDANFYELYQKAAQIASERAQQITETFLNTFFEKTPHLSEKLKEPSVQSSLYDVQKEYAKKGVKDLESQLVNLLIARIDSEEMSLKQLALDEALTILPKLTKSHIALLSFKLVVSQIEFIDIVSIPLFERFINEIVVGFFPEDMSNHSFFTHLQYCGCYMLPAGMQGYMTFEQYYKERYKGLLTNGFTESQFVEATNGMNIKSFGNFIVPNLRNSETFQFDAINDSVFNERLSRFDLGVKNNLLRALWNNTAMSDEEVRETLIKINPKMKQVCNAWTRTIMCAMQLTSVGYAIAVSNFNYVTGKDFKFEAYI